MIQVLDFDGIEGRVVVDNYRGVASSGIPFPHNDDRSLSFWIQTTQSGLATVCYWGDDLTETGFIPDGQQNRIRLIKDRLEIFGRGSYRRTDSVINDGSRHHVVFTYTSTGVTLGHEDFGIANVYVDNVLDNGANRTGGFRDVEYRGEYTTTSHVDTPLEHIVVLGARPVGSGVTTASGHFTEYFEGNLTDFAIYHDVLTETTRTALYNLGVPGENLLSLGQVPALELWYPIVTASGDAAPGTIIDRRIAILGGADGTASVGTAIISGTVQL